MGNMHCPAEDAAHLASVARDICPFPNYTPNPLFFNMLSVNSSLHLRNHYMAVQSSLTPKQLEDFIQSLRTTFGREGKVTLGGVGVVALSLAVLFDTLARQVRGEWVSDSGPVPGLFVKDLRGYNPPYVNTVSDYLRLVPHIANNPIRMKEEAERYFKQLITDHQSLENLGNHMLPLKEDVTAVNVMLGQMFGVSLKAHLLRIENGTIHGIIIPDTAPTDIIWNLNCDPEKAEKEFLAEVQKSDRRTQEAFKRCAPKSEDVPTTWLQHVAQLVWLDVMLMPVTAVGNDDGHSVITQREDFDLKANALRKWPE